MDSDSDMDPVWGGCWLVVQLLQPPRTALIILLMHAHLGLVTENSNMGNLASVGSMEEASSRNGSDEIARSLYVSS